LTVELVHSDPPEDMQQRVLRLRADARALCETMSGAQARAVFLILEAARDDLSKVLERSEFKQ
jgi:hypothetical protein